MLWWTSLALAAPPLSLSASVQATAEVEDSGIGHDVRLGLPFRTGSRWLAEVTSASTNGARFELRGGVRWFLDEPWTHRGALSLTGSFGAAALPSTSIVTLGVAYDSPIRERLVGRFGLEAVGGNDISGLRASVGLVLPARRPEPVVQIVYIDRPVEPEEPDVDVTVTEMIWVPAPVCDWLPADEAQSLLAETQLEPQPEPQSEPQPEPQPEPQLEPQLPEPVVTVEPVPAVQPEPEALAPMGDALAAMATSSEGLPFWSPEVVQGVLIVLAHPGDTVRLDGAAVPVDERGIAMMRRDEGAVSIEVSSGGQLQTLKAALVQGHAVWVRAQDPSPSEVYFAYDVSELDAAALSQISAVANNAADWSFVLQGGYSPEGTLDYNRDLAIERARNVSRALQDAGIPADRIVFLDPPPPDPNRRAEQQRNCRIIPIAPEAEGSG
ncbi:MAG: OmpA family protein [Myxococcota bacterium]